MAGFSQYVLKGEAFSTSPFQILGPEEKGLFSFLMEVILLETGDGLARERWQTAQLTNLLSHAAKRSKFWNERFDGKKPAQIKLSRLPIMTRGDLNEQFQKEGSLLTRNDGVPVQAHATSGSTGVPAKFYVSQANTLYNDIRYFAQHYMEDRDIRLNTLRCKPKFPLDSPGFVFRQSDSYAGQLGRIFKTGLSASIDYANPDLDKLILKIKSFRPSYLTCASHLVEMLLDHAGAACLRDFGLNTYIPIGAAVPAWVKEQCANVGVSVRSNYSCEEVGLIASECVHAPGFFHVATSNVIVEISPDKVNYDGVECGRILVTHLHSYATPMIRYDLGDLGNLQPRCACGHDGATLTNLFGRIKMSLKHKDGRRTPFHIRGQELSEVVPFEEYRIRQTELDAIVLEIATPHKSDASAEKLKAYLQGVTGDNFAIEVKFVDAIDWGQSVKRLAFLSDVEA
ncbi:phenylacetate--CoA ligase family protein [Methylocapsa acidiphila]|uniref:phenylacetate--CoA ligase family protein n=1 Tax=Methylocapsa acidiphila TaxID=133552 RepID=UPI00042A169A|nr:phenylacetate--CoA ligase family protein [Methylocapsa acidiphila]